MRNHNVSRRTFLQFAGVATAGTLLSACVAPAAAPTAGGDATAPDAAPVEVRMGHWWGEKFDQLIPMAEENYNITIQNEPVGWGEYWTKLPAQLASGTAADVVLMDAGKQYDFMREGALLAWDDYLEAEGVDLSLWAVPPHSEGGWSDGKLYSLGMSFTVVMGIWVNMELAEETGIEPPVWGSAEFDTWGLDKWVEFWQAGTKRSADGTVEQYGLSTNPITWGAYGGVLQWFKMYEDVDWLDDYFFDDSEFLANSPQSVAAMERTWGLTTVDQICPTDAESQLLQGGYWRAGKSLCEWYFTVVHAFPEMTEQGNIQLAALPRETSAAKQAGPNAWCVPAGAAKPDMGQMLGLALTGYDEEIGTVATQINELPAANAVKYREASEGFANSVFNVQTCRFEGISNHEPSTENAAIAPFQFGSKAPAEFQRIMNTEMEKARLGQSTWQEAMDAAKAQIDPLLVG